MANRDVESIRSKSKFVSTLRRVADAIEKGEGVRIQVASARFIVPAGAALSIEHEAADGNEELELQLKWTTPGEPAKKKSAKKKSAKKKSAKKKG